jgi:hypothetical protein
VVVEVQVLLDLELQALWATTEAVQASLHQLVAHKSNTLAVVGVVLVALAILQNFLVWVEIKPLEMAVL